MSTFITRLTSRKFLMAVAGLLVLAAERQWSEFVIVLMGYLGIEGGVDAINTRRGF